MATPSNLEEDVENEEMLQQDEFEEGALVLLSKTSNLRQEMPAC